jgi:hypothetical protein
MTRRGGMIVSPRWQSLRRLPFIVVQNMKHGYGRRIFVGAIILSIIARATAQDARHPPRLLPPRYLSLLEMNICGLFPFLVRQLVRECR